MLEMGANMIMAEVYKSLFDDEKIAVLYTTRSSSGIKQLMIKCASILDYKVAEKTTKNGMFGYIVL